MNSDIVSFHDDDEDEFWLKLIKNLSKNGKKDSYFIDYARFLFVISCSNDDCQQNKFKFI